MIFPLSLFLLYFLLKTSLLIIIPLKEIPINSTSKITNNKNITSFVNKDIIIFEKYCLYAAELTIGSNNKKFFLLVDTGSTITWVAKINNEDYGVKINNQYNPEESTTSKNLNKKFSIEYGSGQASGIYYSDTIKFILPTSFYFNFGASDKTNFSLIGIDGIMGLGRKYNSDSYSIIKNMKNKGIISNSKFSFKYDTSSKILYFILGEQHSDFNNNKNVGNCPLISTSNYGEELWSCTMTSFGINNKNNYLYQMDFSVKIIFDTGTNYIVLPIQILDYFKNYLYKYECSIYTIMEGKYGIICENYFNLPYIIIGIQDYKLTLNNEHLYIKIKNNGKVAYLLRVEFEDSLSIPIIGQSFFFDFHTLFDDEEKNIKFYTPDSSKIAYKKVNTNGNTLDLNNDDSSWPIWVIILFWCIFSVVLILIIIIVICCCCRRHHTCETLMDEMNGNYHEDLCSIQKNSLSDYNQIEENTKTYKNPNNSKNIDLNYINESDVKTRKKKLNIKFDDEPEKLDKNISININFTDNRIQNFERTNNLNGSRNIQSRSRLKNYYNNISNNNVSDSLYPELQDINNQVQNDNISSSNISRSAAPVCNYGYYPSNYNNNYARNTQNMVNYYPNYNSLQNRKRIELRPLYP